MNVKSLLSDLLTLGEGKDPVVSVYLDTHWVDQHHRERVHAFWVKEKRRLMTHDFPGDGDFERSLQAVDDYLAGLVRNRYGEWAHGCAIFSCAPRGLFRVVHTRVRLDDAVYVATRPQLAPFISAAQRTPPLIIAAIDSEGGHLWSWSLGEVDVDASIERGFPGRHGRGGWSQRRMQGHLQRLLENNLKEVAAGLVSLADENPEAFLVLAGTHPVLADFEAHHLPRRLMDRVLARVPYPNGAGEVAIRDLAVAHALPLVDVALLERAREARDDALSEAAKPGLGVLGLDAVMEAVTEGRAQRIVIAADHDERGWECTNCHALGPREVASCRYCEGKVEEVSISEALFRKALDSDLEVVVLPAGLDLPSGVKAAARLRHRHAVLQPSGGAESERAFEAGPYA